MVIRMLGAHPATVASAAILVVCVQEGPKSHLTVAAHTQNEPVKNAYYLAKAYRGSKILFVSQYCKHSFQASATTWTPRLTRFQIRLKAFYS